MKRLEIASTAAEAARLQEALIEEAQAAGFGDNSLFAIRLALDEALSNAIRHGNGNDPSKRVGIEYDIDSEEFRISITDQGHGFNPDRLPDPTADEFLDRPHGRGVMLMRAYMTKVDFNPRGNRVTMVKHRLCPLPQAN